MRVGVRLRGFLSLSVTACFFGLGVVLAKLLTGVFSPVLLACLALGCGGLLVTLLLLVTRRPLLPPASRAIWGNLLVLGVFGTALPLVLVIAGFSMTSAVVGGVLIQAQGPAAVLLAAIILRERPSLAQLIGIAIIILGGVLVVVQPRPLVPGRRAGCGARAGWCGGLRLRADPGEAAGGQGGYAPGERAALPDRGDLRYPAALLPANADDWRGLVGRLWPSSRSMC